MSDDGDYSSTMHDPLVTDFEAFLPWACKRFGVKPDVVVNKFFINDILSEASSHGATGRISKRQDVSVVDMIPSLMSKPSRFMNFQSKQLDPISNLVINAVYDGPNLVIINFRKGDKIHWKVMKIIGLIITYHHQLQSIHIRGGLNKEGLYEIGKFLPQSSITEIVFDDTFVKEGNFHVVLGMSSLKSLSLARCKINDDVVMNIALELDPSKLASSKLCALNLTSNFITDVGANYLGKILRSNRTLLYLNLSSNMITDTGASYILDHLKAFPVIKEETRYKRELKIEYLMKKQLLLADLMKIQPATVVAKKQPKMPKIIYNLESTVLGILGPFIRPFSNNNIYLKDNVTYCHGNFTLCYLNFRYNSMSYLTMKKIVEVLNYQKNLEKNMKGIVNILIDGNMLPVDCEEYRIIYDYQQKVLASDKMRRLMKKGLK